MKCARCGAITDVAETRVYMDIFVRRTRECFNGHRTTTYEVPPGALDRRQLDVIRRKVDQRAQAQRRKLVVIRAPAESTSSLAARLGITEARVRQIRKESMQCGS